MNMSFYTAAVGAQQQQRRLDIHGNNLANVNTYGFRARVPQFMQLMNVTMEAISEDIPRAAGAKLENAEADQRTSGLTETGRALDYAIEGEGFFCLWDPQTGERSYTRDGSFVMSQYLDVGANADAGDGQEVWYLSDGQGRFVLGDNDRPIQITGDQTIEAPGDPLPVGIYIFLNYNGMESISENRFVPVDKNGQAGFAGQDSRLIQGALERSNADVATEFAKVIEAQRSFSYMLRMVNTSDEIESTVNGLR